MRQIKIRGRRVQSYRFRHPDFEGTDLFVAVANCTIVEEGSPEQFFDQPTEEVQAQPSQVANDDGLRSSSTNAVSLPSGSEGLLGRGASRDDIAALRSQNITVDDDNDPAPENVPGPAPPAAAAAASAPPAAIGSTWKWVPNMRICPRKAQGNADTRARFRNYSWDTIANMSPLQVFFLCYPKKYLTEVVIPATNPNLKLGPLDLRELVCFFGCIFYMSCFQGISDRKEWWSRSPPTMNSGAPFRLNKYMSGNRFEDIVQGLRHTTLDPPAYLDRFFEVRQMWDYFNEHYDEEYISSHLSTLDESVAVWLDQHGPGFMFIPRKPHPFGNEYHTIADVETTMTYRMECVEGKDRPAQLGPKEYDDKGKTVGVMLRLTKPLHHTGKIVEQDSGFCVFEGIAAQHQMGVYGDALIKKRRYWPKHVPGSEIDAAMADADIGTVRTLQGKVLEQDVYIHCLKEEEYVTKIMSTHGSHQLVLNHMTTRSFRNPATGQQSTTSFAYFDPFSRYFRARHSVDDNNNRRHQPISIETTWATKWWANRQQGFHLAVAAVNANLASARAKGLSEALPELVARRALAIEMMENTIGIDDLPRQVPVRQVNVVAPGHMCTRSSHILLAPTTPPPVNSTKSRKSMVKHSALLAKIDAGTTAHAVLRRICAQTAFWCITGTCNHRLHPRGNYPSSFLLIFGRRLLVAKSTKINLFNNSNMLTLWPNVITTCSCNLVFIGCLLVTKSTRQK